MQKKDKVKSLNKRRCIKSMLTVDTMIPEHWTDDEEFVDLEEKE